ncbi:protein kinase domain-containing protein [Ditylenchus destructor]|uniref:Protein kinase domain-containing protein n=1 Tax=Ditylenchus destructor TaxID=166010 RepID=A0AAD4N7C6_9BILA|nr:protein kinase domain-containing protein [Ditylenchus destructor]
MKKNKTKTTTTNEDVTHDENEFIHDIKEKGKTSTSTEDTTHDDDDVIRCHPPSREKKRLAEFNNGYKSAELDSNKYFKLFGNNIPLIMKNHQNEYIVSKLKYTFKIGETIESEHDKYKIERPLAGRRYMFEVSQVKGKKKYCMKMEEFKIFHDGSNIKNEIDLLKNSRITNPVFRQHFLQLIDNGCVKDRHFPLNSFNFFVTPLGGCNLKDLRLRLSSGEFMPNDAVRICLQTLQAIHDVHLCHFIHRNIRPGNFILDLEKKNIVYLVNFGFAFRYYPNKTKSKSILPKLRSLNRRFQPRTFHTRSEYGRLGDIESWIYLCFWLFDSKCLPWTDLTDGNDGERNGRDVCYRKNLFFTGFYDKLMMEKTEQYFPSALWAIRNRVNVESVALNPGPVNYSYFGEAIISMQREIKINGDEPYEWEPKHVKRPYQDYLKHNHTGKGAYCIICENSPYAKTMTTAKLNGKDAVLFNTSVAAVAETQDETKSSSEEEDSSSKETEETTNSQ